MIDLEKLGILRLHQDRGRVVANELVAGRRHQKIVVAGVTPGGGKTLMSAIFANVLADHSMIEQVLVVVPNDPLRLQMFQSFHDPSRGLCRYLGRVGGQRQGNLPGLGAPFGTVVTYQALTSDVALKRWVRWASKKRTLVIFDECHHLCEQKAWVRAAEKLVEASRLVLMMSGTLWRWDEERIPFVTYDSSGKAAIDIRYSRTDALREKAILPVEFRFFDGKACYEFRDKPHDTALSTATAKEQARAVKTALMNDEFVHPFLAAGMQDFERYRASYYPSQAIGVFHDKKRTRAAASWGRGAFPKNQPVVSLCGESGSDKAIVRFREGTFPVLFTVRKAYEGLDVRGATHLFYLGDSRSWPFLDQVIARVTRYNDKAPLSWEEQRGYVYVPDDKRTREYVQNMMEEQDAYYRERDDATGTTSTNARRGRFVPVSAEQTGSGYGMQGHVCTTEENIGLSKLAERYPQLRAPLTYRLEFANILGLIPLAPGGGNVRAAE
jgi:superfamily II DNA or RNA helicase